MLGKNQWVGEQHFGFLENILGNQETIPGVGGGQEQKSGLHKSHKGTLEEQEAATTVNPQV